MADPKLTKAQRRVLGWIVTETEAPFMGGHSLSVARRLVGKGLAVDLGFSEYDGYWFGVTDAGRKVLSDAS